MARKGQTKAVPEIARAMPQRERSLVQPVPPAAFQPMPKLTGTASATKAWLAGSIITKGQDGKEVNNGARNELVAKGIDIAIARFSAGDFGPDILAVIKQLAPYLFGVVAQKVKVDVNERSTVVMGMINMAEEQKRKHVQNVLMNAQRNEQT